MCTITCSIEYENATECYRPGEVIKGLVVLTVSGTNTILIKGK